MGKNSNLPKWAVTRPSEPFAPEEAPTDGMTPDELAVMEVLLSMPVCGRERDMALLELTDEQLALYMELFHIAGEVETYRQSKRDYWRYIDANPHIYNHDGTTHWGRDERKH